MASGKEVDWRGFKGRREATEKSGENEVPEWMKDQCGSWDGQGFPRRTSPGEEGLEREEAVQRSGEKLSKIKWRTSNTRV